MYSLGRVRNAIIQNTPDAILQPVMRWWKRRRLRANIGVDPEAVFTRLVRSSEWGGSESLSGSGSDLAATAQIRAALPGLLDKYQVRSILDAPCGDFHWIKHVDLGECTYFGGDIVRELVERNQQLYASPRRSFCHIDITRDELPPRCDLVLCRDCFIHLPFDMALSAIRNFKRSGARYFMTTTHPDTKRRWDTPPGGWHPIAMHLEPFRFPPPLELIREEPHRDPGKHPLWDKSLGLWRFEDIDV